MPRELDQRIDDIIACCEKIVKFTAGLGQAELIEQDLVMDAVLRNIEVIGEAAKNVPQNAQDKMPAIEWTKIAGMRDWISHVYYRVDDDIVWDVVENKIPELLRTLKAFRQEDPGS